MQPHSRSTVENLFSPEENHKAVGKAKAFFNLVGKNYYCFTFCLELADGSLRVLSWGNVVEVSAAGQGERFDEGDRADRADRS